MMCRNTRRADQRRARLEPGCLGQRVRGVEVGQRGDELVGAPGDGVVALEDRRQGLARVHPERCRVRGVVGLTAERQRRRAEDDEVGPARLGVGDVLDQAADAQRRHRAGVRRLGVGQVAGGGAQELAVRRQRLEQVAALGVGVRCGAGRGVGDGAWWSCGGVCVM